MTEFDNRKPNFSQNAKRKSPTDRNKNNADMTKSDKNQDLTAELKKDTSQRNTATDETILKNPVANPIWLSISESAKLGGVNTKTIRRAIQSEKIKYRIYKNRYLIGLRSLILYLNSNTKLKNKLNFNGIGQYIKGWRK